MRPRWLGSGTALLLTLALPSCGETPAPGEDRGEPAEGALAPREAPPPPCETEGFPCTWGEVAPEDLRLTDELGWIAADIIRRTGSAEETADFLRNANGVAEVWKGPFAVQFRVEGGRPAWVDLPSDPENPRLGGGPASAPVPAPAPLRASRLQEEDGNGVAAPGGEEGTPKRALFLSPVAWDLDGIDNDRLGKDPLLDQVLQLAEVRDYQEKHGGEITYRANLYLDRKNPTSHLLDQWSEEERNAGTEVGLEHFRSWGDYNFVYLLTHGKMKCAETGCYTVLDAGQLLPGAPEAAEELGEVPGVELDYIFSPLDREGLTRNERGACIAFFDERTDPGAEVGRDAEGDLVVDPAGSAKPCFREQDLEHAMVSVTTEFFRDVYGEGLGLENVVIFLAACQSLKASIAEADADGWPGDLVAVLTGDGRNENIAVLGFDEVSYSSWTALIGSDLILAMGELGLDNEATYEELRNRYPQAPLTGVVLSAGAEADTGRPSRLTPATLQNRSSNPTHARDVVELVDPLTGEELEDGAGVIALGSPNDGEPDRIRVGMHVRGIDEDTDVDAIEVYLKVDDRESEPYELTHAVEPHIMRVGKEEVDLGFDLGEKETVDLEIRAVLEGGGESRWRYDSLKLASWTLSVASPSLTGRYAGFQGFFNEGMGVGQLSLCSAEGPHVLITAGVEDFDGPGTYVLGNGPDQQEGNVAVSPLDWRGVSPAEAEAAVRAMANFITGDGESVLYQPGGAAFRIPPTSTLEITRVTEDHVEGAVSGTFFRQTPSGTFERANVAFSFVTRRHDPLGGALSMMTGSEEMLCADVPGVPR